MNLSKVKRLGRLLSEANAVFEELSCSQEKSYIKENDSVHLSNHPLIGALVQDRKTGEKGTVKDISVDPEGKVWIYYKDDDFESEYTAMSSIKILSLK